jgi:Flp pilus assembly protein TadD
MSGNFEESVMAARRLVALDPRQTAAWVRLALAERNVGNYAAAAQAMNRAVQVQGGGRSAVPKKKPIASKKKS